MPSSRKPARSTGPNADFSSGPASRRSTNSGATDPVQAQAAGHDDQPAPLVGDLADVRGQQAGERILHGVLGGADVTEHPEREIDQVRAMVPVRLNDLGAVGRLAHWSGPSAARR
jgi:hypothetical protein